MSRSFEGLQVVCVVVCSDELEQMPYACSRLSQWYRLAVASLTIHFIRSTCRCPRIIHFAKLVLDSKGWRKRRCSLGRLLTSSANWMPSRSLPCGCDMGRLLRAIPREEDAARGSACSTNLRKDQLGSAADHDKYKARVLALHTSNTQTMYHP